MRVIVLPAENVIFVDGKGKLLNCESLRLKQVKSIRWFDTIGVITYVNGASRKIGKIDRLDPEGWSLQSLIDRAKPFEGKS